MAVPRKSPLPPSSADLAQEYRIACHKKAGVRVDEDMLASIQSADLRLQLLPYNNESLDVLFHMLPRLYGLKSVDLRLSVDESGRSNGRRLKIVPEDSPLHRQEVALKLATALRLALRKSPGLRKLQLEGLKLHGESLRRIVEGLEKCPSIAEVSLVNCNVGDQSFPAFAKYAVASHNILALTLRSCGLSAKSAGSVSSILKGHCSYRDDIVWARGLRADINGDDGLVSSGILAFDASDNELGDDFVKSLARLLPRDNWLKAICLQNIGLSEQAALELKGALELNSALDVLDISRNNAAGSATVQTVIQMCTKRYAKSIIHTSELLSEVMVQWKWPETFAAASTTPLAATTVATNVAAVRLDPKPVQKASVKPPPLPKRPARVITPKRRAKSAEASKRISATAMRREEPADINLADTMLFDGIGKPVSPPESVSPIDDSFATARHLPTEEMEKENEALAKQLQDAHMEITELRLERLEAETRVQLLEKRLSLLESQVSSMSLKTCTSEQPGQAVVPGSTTNNRAQPTLTVRKITRRASSRTRSKKGQKDSVRVRQSDTPESLANKVSRVMLSKRG